MTKGLYERTPEMNAAMSEVLKNSEAAKAAADAQRSIPKTPEHCDAISKGKTGIPLSPEHIAAIKKGIRNSNAVKAKNEAQRGVPKSPETCAAISKGNKESESRKASTERQRGGNDLVNHHYIYDHSDLSKNTVQMTRSDHMSLHRLLQKLGYIVPRINVPDGQSKDD